MENCISFQNLTCFICDPLKTQMRARGPFQIFFDPFAGFEKGGGEWVLGPTLRTAALAGPKSCPKIIQTENTLNRKAGHPVPYLMS